MSPASSPTLDSLSGEPHVSSLDCWRKQNSRSPSHTISLRLLTSLSFSFLHNLTFPFRPIRKYYTTEKGTNHVGDLKDEKGRGLSSPNCSSSSKQIHLFSVVAPESFHCYFVPL
ncbi:hypothetical protein AMECASPLE_015022 [Ameca splendens]|uniref:Uncharacterized protein n=1 Tax=Ameca splendens TaxID=208324 RepID=A0ABV0Y1R9_9TELE